ncbi:hypothetical protein NPX13_g3203 [Xylaria arbuscula]|uniref:C2 NT-type domain-containing protein n=1 Tax=Xylaria arbuscula TaxID=114810 RepID=A0A9W8NHR3_9PEZI|nr:hypothetical protein NPX13_g3203 [Xylaria arbuscula]
MRVLPIVNKARKPKFELHLWIYDLNNVPLVAGKSYVKWHLPGSIHGEHRGRTPKCSVDKIHHRATYNYSKTVPLRIQIDRANNLTECPIEFEVLQEFATGPAGRDERISLGHIRLNLSEYVEESENHTRRSTASRLAGTLDHARDKVSQHIPHRKLSVGRSASESERPSASFSASAAAHHPEENDVVDEEAEEGIVRRYLMQDSKINSTLKIGILMVQADGERNYVAPPLKSATMFMGGISSIIAGANEQAEVEESGDSGGALPSMTKSRDAAEAQDMYRRALAASWDCHPGELHADECIEDIFAGGDGWRDGTNQKSARSHIESPNPARTSSSSSRTPSTSSDDATGGTIRQSDVRRIQHFRELSGASDKSNATITGLNDNDYGMQSSNLPPPSRPSPQTHHRQRFAGHGGRSLPYVPQREDSGVSLFDESSPSPGLHSRNESMTSLVPTLGSSTGSGSERGGGHKSNGFRRPREIDEYELRDDLVAWSISGTTA